ncbi:DUF5677 domain-containing protein [Nesterenkonia massiliensis]|uniref:DUF5677 domain-containing protein n=1 Tax=Nesterenkonia massiliensis TaxID=1232429 RepID=UPI0005CA334D|nr:DUF5677 domain-containing protein [Nesterenkonia massiliensis]
MDLLAEDTRNEIEQWQWCVKMFPGLLSSHLTNDAQKHIFNAAANDALSLIRQVDLLEGRAAALLARALFEHLVNFMDVTNSDVNTSERFMAHKHIVAEQLSKRTWVIGGMTPANQRSEKKRLKALEAAATRPVREAIAKYGKRFRNGWAEGTIRDRAERLGTEEGYIGYRVLSGVVHGSSGGLQGLVRSIKGGTTLRIGSDLELTALAFEEGLGSFLEFVRALRVVVDRIESEELEARTYQVLERFEEIRDACIKVDKKMWPKHPAPFAAISAVAIFPGGKVRWYLHDFRDETMTPAEDPDPVPDLSRELQAAKAHIPEMFGGRPYVRPRLDVAVEPKRGATRFPAEALLIPGDHEFNPTNLGFTAKDIARDWHSSLGPQNGA